MVGSLLYAMVGTRYDIAFGISVVSKFLSNPKKGHCDLVRHIFKYLKANPEFFIRYKSMSDDEVKLECFAYQNQLNERSTTGFCLTNNNVIVDWSSKCQKGNHQVKQNIWLPLMQPTM